MPLQDSPHNHSYDRILVLKVKDGETALSTTGLLDNRLFTNENRLHAVMDPATCLWYFKQEQGILPSALKTKWTSFERLYKWAQGYFDRRNVEIVNVIE